MKHVLGIVLATVLIFSVLVLTHPLPAAAAAYCSASCKGSIVACSGDPCKAKDNVGCCGSGGFQKCGGYNGDPLVCDES